VGGEAEAQRAGIYGEVRGKEGRVRLAIPFCFLLIAIWGGGIFVQVKTNVSMERFLSSTDGQTVIL
jgi:hypothetical protein